MEEHKHNFAKAGCWCGAKQCEHVDTMVKPGYRPRKERCTAAARPDLQNVSRCEKHQGMLL